MTLLLMGAFLSTLCDLALFTLTNSFTCCCKCGRCYCPHFTDEKMEAGRGARTSSKSQSRYGLESVDKVLTTEDWAHRLIIK